MVNQERPRRKMDRTDAQSSRTIELTIELIECAERHNLPKFHASLLSSIETLIAELQEIDRPATGAPACGEQAGCAGTNVVVLHDPARRPAMPEPPAAPCDAEAGRSTIIGRV